MLHFIFEDIKKNEVHYRDQKTSSVIWNTSAPTFVGFLSIDANHLEKCRPGREAAYRSIDIEGEDNFSGGFTDLHLKSYQNILAGGKGYAVKRTGAIQTVSDMPQYRNPRLRSRPHPLLARVLS